MLVVVIGTSTPSTIWADHSRLQVIRSKQTEWHVASGVTGVCIVIPELEFSQCEILKLLVSQPIQIIP